jgi:hypothetical protein
MQNTGSSATLCTASDRVMVEGKPIGLMYRVKPAAPGDSGWRFFSGDEDAAYLGNPANFHQHPLSAVSARDPQIVPLLTSPVGAGFRRDPRTGGLVKADDWEAPILS